MFNFPIELTTPNSCFAQYRYAMARSVTSHLHLIGILSMKLGIPSIGYLYYLSVIAHRKNPKNPPLINVIGGSSHSADVPKSALEQIFRTVAEAVGIKHGFLSLHLSRSGRVDFHFMFVNSTPEGRPLVPNLAKFRQAFRSAMRDVVDVYNRERLHGGGLSIGNLTPKGRTFFVERPQPEPAPEIAQPAPAPGPNAPMDTEPPPSEPSGLHAPATRSLDIGPAIPTSDVVIPPAAETDISKIDPEVPSAVERPANSEAPPPAPSAVTSEAAVIATEPMAPDQAPLFAKSLHAITSEPTGKFESLPSPSPLPLVGTTSVAAPAVVHEPNEPAAEPSRNQPSSPPVSADSKSSDFTGISPHRDTATAPIPTEPPSQLNVGSANRAGEAAAPVDALAPAKLELHVSNGVQPEPPPAPSNPALESPPPTSSVPPTDLAPPTATEQPLVPHRPDEPSAYAIEERARKRNAAAAEKERKEQAAMAAAARKLARSRFNWTEQLRLLRAAGKGYQKYLDQPAGPAWAAWIGMAPRTSTSPATLREILLQFLKYNPSAHDFKTIHDAAQFFKAIEQLCGPIEMNLRERESYLAAREFPWELLLARTIKEHAANAQNPLTLKAGSDWGPLSQHFTEPGEHPTLGTLIDRVRHLDPLNAAAARFYQSAIALDDQSYEPKQIQVAPRAHDGPELEF